MSPVRLSVLGGLIDLAVLLPIAGVAAWARDGLAAGSMLAGLACVLVGSLTLWGAAYWWKSGPVAQSLAVLGGTTIRTIAAGGIALAGLLKSEQETKVEWLAAVAIAYLVTLAVETSLLLWWSTTVPSVGDKV